MGAGKKVAIGCGGLLVLVTGALYFGIRWVNHNLAPTMDPVAIYALGAEIINIQIPDGFEPCRGIYTREAKTNPLATFKTPTTRTEEASTLLLYARTGDHTAEDMISLVAQEGEKLGINPGMEGIGQDETFPVRYLGKEYQALLREGLGKDQKVRRELLTVIPQGDKTLFIRFTGDPEIIRRDLLQEVLDSGLKADSMMPTPPTDEGKTSATDS